MSATPQELAWPRQAFENCPWAPHACCSSRGKGGGLRPAAAPRPPATRRSPPPPLAPWFPRSSRDCHQPAPPPRLTTKAAAGRPRRWLSGGPAPSPPRRSPQARPGRLRACGGAAPAGRQSVRPSVRQSVSPSVGQAVSGRWAAGAPASPPPAGRPGVSPRRRAGEPPRRGRFCVSAHKGAALAGWDGTGGGWLREGAWSAARWSGGWGVCPCVPSSNPLPRLSGCRWWGGLCGAGGGGTPGPWGSGGRVLSLPLPSWRESRGANPGAFANGTRGERSRRAPGGGCAGQPGCCAASPAGRAPSDPRAEPGAAARVSPWLAGAGEPVGRFGLPVGWLLLGSGSVGCSPAGLGTCGGGWQEEENKQINYHVFYFLYVLPCKLRIQSSWTSGADSGCFLTNLYKK